MKLTGRDIVCVGFSDWQTDLLTNQQHLLVRAARENRILFVESLGLRKPQLAARDVSRIGRRLVSATHPLREVDGVHVLSPLVVPLHTNELLRRVNGSLLTGYVRWAVRRLGMHDPLLWAFVPQAEVLIDVLKPPEILYYIDDDHAAKEGIDAANFLSAERRFAPLADAVIASAPELVEKMRELNPNVHYGPNVADTDLFATALEPGRVDPEVDALPEPRIVFIGAILAAKIDIPLLVELARLRPQWSFALVGPIGPGDPRTDVSGLRGLPNVHMLGYRPYEQLPDVLRSANVAIVPYLLEGEMRSVFPMKIYEYLAAGRPVVATPMETLSDVPDVAKAATAEQFATAIEHEMAADGPQAREARSQRARGHSWESRLDQIADALAAAPPSRRG